MYFEEIGHEVRVARLAKKMTQADLAQAVGLSRITVNQIESGACPDLGVRKLLNLLEVLGMDVSVKKRTSRMANKSDFLEMACISANVSYRGHLEKQELVRALISGKVPQDKRPQLRVVFDELPPSIFDGMVKQVSAWCSEKKLTKNLADVARKLHSVRRFSI